MKFVRVWAWVLLLVLVPGLVVAAEPEPKKAPALSSAEYAAWVAQTCLLRSGTTNDCIVEPDGDLANARSITTVLATSFRIYSLAPGAAGDFTFGIENTATADTANDVSLDFRLNSDSTSRAFARMSVNSATVADASRDGVLTFYVNSGGTLDSYLQLEGDNDRILAFADFRPSADGTLELGSSSASWADVYTDAMTLTANPFNFDALQAAHQVKFNVGSSGSSGTFRVLNDNLKGVVVSPTRSGAASAGQTLVYLTEADQLLQVSGGSSVSSGANLIFYGQSHATLAGDSVFRNGTTNWLFHDASASAVYLTGSVVVGATAKLLLDGSAAGDTYWTESSTNTARLFVGGNRIFQSTASIPTFRTAAATNLIVEFDTTDAGDMSALRFMSGGTSNWLLRNDASDNLEIYNYTAAEYALEITGSNSQIMFGNDTLRILDGIIDFKGTYGSSTKNPAAVAEDGWIEIKVGGTTYYIPYYAAS